MAKVTITKALSSFFNVNTLDATKPGDKALLDIGANGKRTVTQWAAELKKLTNGEKTELAEMVCAITGDTLSAGPAPAVK